MTRKEYNKDYRQNYGEKMKEQIMKWFEAHPDYRKTYNEKWYKKNRNYHKVWRLENIKSYKKNQKRWNEENHTKKSIYMKFYMRRYRANHVRS